MKAAMRSRKALDLAAIGGGGFFPLAGAAAGSAGAAGAGLGAGGGDLALEAAEGGDVVSSSLLTAGGISTAGGCGLEVTGTSGSGSAGGGTATGAGAGAVDSCFGRDGRDGRVGTSGSYLSTNSRGKIPLLLAPVIQQDRNVGRPLLELGNPITGGAEGGCNQEWPIHPLFSQECQE